MRLLLHYVKVYQLILFRQHACSTLSLLLNYSHLVLQAHLAPWFASSNKTWQITLFGKKVFFQHYGALANQFEEIFVLDCYQFAALSSPPLILDVGAHIGMSLLYFKQVYPNATLIAFEPDPDNYSLLRQFVQYNQFSSDITLHQIALSSTSGKAVLYKQGQGTHSLTSSLSASSLQPLAIEVQTEKLSQYFTSSVSFLKLDIEGAELQVMNEVVSSGKLHLIQEIVLEFHCTVNPDYHPLLQQMTELGFTAAIEEVTSLSPKAPDLLLRFKNISL